MSKLAEYLREHLAGEVLDSNHVRDWFSTDGSILTLKPKAVVYPRRISDIAKVNKFLWKLSEKGAKLGLTSRGAGSDQSGGAVGDGIIMAFGAHMNKILELDTSKNIVKVQPGINYAALQQTLHTHGKFLPPYPSSIDFATIGGSVANNAGGEKSVKYGVTGNYVLGLKVVLANGDLIETGRLTKREVKKKKMLKTFEGELYREIDSLTMAGSHEIASMNNIRVSKNSTGYNLKDIRKPNGSIDLTPLFVGSQGTLGVIVEITLKVENYNPSPSLVVAEFSDISSAERAVSKLIRFKPSALEMVDGNLIDFVKKSHPNQIDGLIQSVKTPAVIILCEFDDALKMKRKAGVAKSLKVLGEYTKFVKVSDNIDEQDLMWKIRHSAALVLSHKTASGSSALPMIEDACVPASKLGELTNGVYALFNKYRLDSAVWGHAGDANLHIEPFLNLSAPNDRRKVFKIIDEYNRMVIGMGGTIAGEHNDGRLRAPYLKLQYGEKVYELFEKVKNIFDPQNIMNPGVKIGVKESDNIGLLRSEFDISRYNNHIPRS
jgi:FAD/FMN-containing dehydrogenase